MSDATLAARDAAVLWHPYTQHLLDREPLPVAAAEGALLRLADGREVIDAVASWWTCLHGHAHPRLVEAIRRQVATLDHVMFAGCTHAPAVELAEALIGEVPAGLSRVFYSDNGSTAVEVALKMVYQSWVHQGEPERATFVALDGAYHGDTFGAMSVGERQPFFTAFAPLLFDVRRVPVSPIAVAAALAALGARAAGVIIEPLVQGAAGMVMHDADFVRAVRVLCDQHGVPLIADEVMTGFGRTGTLFACARAGVTPDLLCLAKGLTGGTFPLAATLATEAVFEQFLSADRARTFFHGHTFTAHPVGCAAALASLQLCREEAVPDRLDAIGARIAEALAPLAGDPRVRELRRTGGIVALELEALPDRAGYLSDRLRQVPARAIAQGVLLRPLGNVLYAMPPACTSETQCDRIAGVMADAVRSLD